MLNKSTTILIIGNTLKHSQAIELAQKTKNNKINFVLAGMLPQIPGDFYRVPSVSKLEQKLQTELNTKLTSLSRCLGISNNRYYITKDPIQHLAKRLNAHLIIDTEEPKENFPFLASLFKKKNMPSKQNEIPSIYLEDYLKIMNLPPLTKERPAKITAPEVIQQDPVFHNKSQVNEAEGLYSWLVEKNTIKVNFEEKESKVV